MKLLYQRPVTGQFDRQVAEVQRRIAIPNGRIALAIPITSPAG